MNFNESMADIKEKLCKKLNIPSSCVRFIFNGHRILDNETPNSLQITSGDVIEVFTEMKGGGKKTNVPKQKERNISDDHDQIRNILDMSSDDDEQYVTKDHKKSGNVKEVDKRTISDKSEGFVQGTMMDEDKSVLQETQNVNINESLLNCEGNELNELQVQTPQKRAKLYERFQLKTPSPLVKLSKVTIEEMKRFSLAVHLYAEENLGGIKGLQSTRLKDIHFQEILEFAGPGTMYNFLKGRSALQYKCLWRNSANSKQSFRGHQNSGFENDSKRHDPSIQYCPFQHCSQETGHSLNPLEIDMRLITPERRETESSDKTSSETSSRQLFQEDKSKHIQTTYSTALQPIIEENEDFDPIMHSVNQSPTKEKLLSRKRKLLNELENVTEKLGKYNTDQSEMYRDKISSNNFSSLICKSKGCKKQFDTMCGLVRHQDSQHSDENLIRDTEKCKICGKEVFYIDKHMRTVHKDALGEEICTVCLKTVKKFEMKKHRGKCISCPICKRIEKKRLRLIDHINKCKQKRLPIPIQKEALDLSSPIKLDMKSCSGKQIEPSSSELTNLNHTILDQSAPPQTHPDSTKPMYKHSEPFKPSQTHQDPLVTLSIHSNQSQPNKIKEKSQIAGDREQMTTASSGTEEVHKKDDEQNHDFASDLEMTPSQRCKLSIKRRKFPFDDNEEDYHSEFEETDTENYTIERRSNKDELELRLREADGIKNLAADGDKIVVSQFRDFMKSTTCGESKDGVEPSTVGIYTRLVQKDILPAFHELFVPFDSRWMLDCTTPKVCTFEGDARAHVSPHEPIYLTPRVLRKALEPYINSESGQQRALLIAATRQFMQFIELHFNNKINLYGIGPLEKVMSYHNTVKSFIDSTKLWKGCNKDKKKTIQNNKVLKEYENPNLEKDILENYQKYNQSKDRRNQIGQILHFATNEDLKPSNKEFTDMGKILMGEIVRSTGCRPVAVYRLPSGAYVGKKPGFDPQFATPENSVLDEEEENSNIYGRLNPNLPPKHLACKHQLEQKVAICPENCIDRCEPQGFNIHVDWDKTRDTRGNSYLHLAKPIKDLMDMYIIIKRRFFAGRKPSRYTENSWLDDDHTSFFLQSSGNPFKAVDLQHVSDAMGVDVTAYSFRRIVSTWALSHASKEIREAEGPSLQHSLKVGQDHYKQNNELQPQKLTQTYIKEDCILPEELIKEIQETEKKVREKVAETDSSRQQKQHQLMVEDSNTKKKLQRERKPLGPNHRILGEDRTAFTALVKEITGRDIVRTQKQWKPLSWRNFIVRTVCATAGEPGKRLRDLWLKMYKGDLQWGVRDDRFRAKEKNWPRKDSNAYLQKKDRNSWIAFAVLKSLQVVSRIAERTSYTNIINKLKSKGK